MSRRWTTLLFSPVGLLLLSAARLIIISDFNTTTATTVASSGGYVNTLLGAVIPLVPIFIPYIALTLLLFRHFVLSIIAFIFAVYITPTTMSLPVVLSLVRAQEHNILTLISDQRPMTFVIALLIGTYVFIFTGSFVEALCAVGAAIIALALFLAAFTSYPSLPASINKEEGVIDRRLFVWVTTERVILIVVALALLLVLFSLAFPAALAALASLVTALIAIVIALVLFPYVYSFYTIPRDSGYYAEVMRAPWLPAEKITLNSGNIYYGYTLSNAGGWFTVLLANTRRIVYLPAKNVTDRMVCQPRMPYQPPAGPPLIPLFYTRPPHIQACAQRDIFPAITSVQSEGESLNAISSLIHVPPEQIISTTNAYQQQRLSAALRRYENCGNWNAPTPIGQHFWYYPHLPS